MYSYSPAYESYLLANKYTADHRFWLDVSKAGYRRKMTIMDRVKRFINENFFFRIEGVDCDDDLERLVVHSCDGQTGDDLHTTSDKENVESNSYTYNGNLDEVNKAGTRVIDTDGQEIKMMEITESNQEPTQLSCLSISVYSAVIIAMVCIFLFIGRDYVKFILFSLQEADFWLSLLVFALLFTIVAFPMTWGYILLNIAAGYLYGLLLGLLIVISCALTGLFIAHCVIRRFLRNFVLAKFTNKSFVAIMNVVDHSSIGFKVVIWARLTPIPFGLQNALFAVCGISTPQFLLASALGMLPTQGMHAYIGSTLRSMEEVINNSSGSTTAYIIFGTQLVIAIGLLGFVIRRARTEFNKLVQNAQSSDSSPSAVLDKTDNLSSTIGVDKAVTQTLAHSWSVSMPGALLVPSQTGERPKSGSFSSKQQAHE